MIGVGRDILGTILPYLDDVIFIGESTDGRIALI
jgi:hypothetical protein